MAKIENENHKALPVYAENLVAKKGNLSQPFQWLVRRKLSRKVPADGKK